MYFTTQVLMRLTEVGFIDWTAGGKGIFMTEIGRFKIRIYETKLPVDRWILKGKKLKDHCVLEIDDNGHIEKYIEPYRDSYTPINYQLFSRARHNADRAPKTDIERALYLEIGNTFGINLLNMEV